MSELPCFSILFIVSVDLFVVIIWTLANVKV